MVRVAKVLNKLYIYQSCIHSCYATFLKRHPKQQTVHKSAGRVATCVEVTEA